MMKELGDLQMKEGQSFITASECYGELSNMRSKLAILESPYFKGGMLLLRKIVLDKLSGYNTITLDLAQHDLTISGANIIADLTLILEAEAYGKCECYRKWHEAFKTLYGVEYNRFNIRLVVCDHRMTELLNIRGNAKIYSRGTGDDLHLCDQLIEEWFEWKDTEAFWTLSQVTGQLAEIKSKLAAM
jgi:hypothetical protein